MGGSIDKITLFSHVNEGGAAALTQSLCLVTWTREGSQHWLDNLFSHVNEGGVAAGLGALDSVYLVDADRCCIDKWKYPHIKIKILQNKKHFVFYTEKNIFQMHSKLYDFFIFLMTDFYTWPVNFFVKIFSYFQTLSKVMKGAYVFSLNLHMYMLPFIKT